jgi:hypothetical protein
LYDKIEFIQSNNLRISDRYESMSNDQIRIKKNTNLGSSEAESDTEMLSQCFVDNGDIEALMNCKEPYSIILGRTGMGKTALILKIMADAEHAVKIDPHDMAFKYIENTNLLDFLDTLGVNLDIFYKLLWRHVLVVELLKIRYDKISFNQWLGDFITRPQVNVARKEALEYLQSYKEEFWQKSDISVKIITDKMSAEISTGVSAKAKGILEASSKDASKISTEEKYEIKSRAQSVVNNLQIQRLTQVFKLLEDEVFNDEQKQYLILIDQLDEKWSDSNTRLKLIKALIEEIKFFRRLKNVKIIIGMRDDLMQQVVNFSMESGFQSEKIETYLLKIKWTPRNLQDFLDKRVRNVFERKYTKQNVTYDDVFPNPRGGSNSINAFQYMLDRSFRRPRDLLQFANTCFENATDLAGISWSIIVKAEKTYSISKHDNLLVEWLDIYPSLKILLKLLENSNSAIDCYAMFSDIDKNLNVYTSIYESQFTDPVSQKVAVYFDKNPNNSKIIEDEIKDEIMLCFYRVGLIGVKRGTQDPFNWSFKDAPTINKSDVKNITKIRIHKMFWKALSIIELED